MPKPKLPVEMVRFVKSSNTVYEWDSDLLAKEVPKRMAMANVDATTLAKQHLCITPQLLCDLTSGRRKWTSIFSRLILTTRRIIWRKGQHLIAHLKVLPPRQDEHGDVFTFDDGMEPVYLP